MAKGRALAVGAALLLTVAGCTSSTEGAAPSSPLPSVGTAGSRSLDVAFGEWASFSDGVTVMVLAPQEFTPSEDVYAQPIWGPVELDEWDHFVRTTVTVRNDSGGTMGSYPWVGLAEASYADEMADKSVDYQGIVDQASGIEEVGSVWNSQDPLQDGEQITYDVGFGIDVGEGIDVPDGVRISVQMGDGFNGEPTETIVFES